MEPEGSSAAVAGEMLARKVLEALKRCEGRNEAPLATAVEISRLLSAEMEFPSAELGEAMVSHLSSDFGRPFLWKVLHHAVACRLVSSLHVLCLLAPKVIRCRWTHPEAYRLFLELMLRYALSFERDAPESASDKIVKSVAVNLHLCQNYWVHVAELGHLLVLFFFEITVAVVDCCINDWGLSALSGDRSISVFGSTEPEKMDMDKKGSNLDDRGSQQVLMRKANSLVAIELLEELTKSRKALILLRLIHLNMPEKFNELMRRILFLEACTLIPEKTMGSKIVLSRLSVNIQRVLVPGCEISSRSFFGRLNSGRSMTALTCSYSGSVISSCWAPFDIYMENVMDGRQLPTTSTIDKLSEMIVALKVLNRASWKEAFSALWISALRLVQRERNPPEGPIPHLHSRLCILLCIIPLAIVNVFKVEKGCRTSHDIRTSLPTESVNGIDSTTDASLQSELISSLQDLEQFSGLLCPPELVIGTANDAASKAAVLISNSQNTNNSMDGEYLAGVVVKSGGNLRHLIVEACIARNLIDNRAYSWPGYLPASVVTFSDPSANQTSPWSSFMEGVPLTPSLVNSLILTPATSYTEVEKVYNLALNGKLEEKSAAAKILCGASLSEGWYIQEHVVNFVVKLLSPPISLSDSGSETPVIDYMPMLSVVLFGASSIDTVHVLSLHGVVPDVAAALLPLCEAFGSLDPSSIGKTSNEFSIYMVFSAAFLFLLRLWKFYKPPLEVGRIGCDLPLEYLLLLHNSRLKSGLNSSSSSKNKANWNSSDANSALGKGLLIDHYPKLRAWYCQNINFVAGSLSGHCNDSHVHHVADKILDMMYRKMAKTSSPSASASLSTSGIGVSSGSTLEEEAYEIRLFPAWDVLEAIPFVVEAILTACAYGRISSRDLTTGLMDLVDYLPATLATIITYFSAEVTRGVWKPVPMNGVDWPSPAQVLQSVESEVREIVAAAGINISSFPFDVTPMLPLPMAALVSLTITFKLDKSLEYIHAVAGPAMEDCASACPRSSMPIIGSLWAQKVRRWHDFIIVSCSRSVFRTDKEAIAQLLRSCFASFLGQLDSPNCLIMNPSGVNKLLGNSISKMGKLPCIAPGFLYLRSCRTIEDKPYLTDVIVGLVTEYAQKSSSRCGNTTWTRLKSSHASMSVVIAMAKEAALLGSCLLSAAGGLLLVQVLYTETVPTWLLSRREEGNGEFNTLGRIVEACAMAYLVVYSMLLTCGVRDQAIVWSFSRRLGCGVRARMNESHMHFLARMLERNLLVGCDPITWKAYVTCFVSLAVTFTPGWISEVSQETLRKLASGLRDWDELDLALSLLERGGVETMGAVAELLSLIR